MKKASLLLISALFGTLICQAQDFKTEVVRLPILTANFGYQYPGADLAKRFGPNAIVGASLGYKTKKNLFFDVDANFIFGTNIREQGILKDVLSQDGEIFDQQAAISEVLLLERGFTLGANVGKLFPLKSFNPNTGILVKFGAGFIQHKLLVQNQNNRIPQLDGDYEKGYDRLTNGIILHQFIGFFNMSNSRLANFYAGFDFTEGFTKGQRDYNFDTRSSGRDNRLDIMYGIKIGWCLPIYKRMANDYYTN